MDSAKSRILLLLIIGCLLFSSMPLPASDEYEPADDYPGYFAPQYDGESMGFQLVDGDDQGGFYRGMCGHDFYWDRGYVFCACGDRGLVAYRYNVSQGEIMPIYIVDPDKDFRNCDFYERTSHLNLVAVAAGLDGLYIYEWHEDAETLTYKDNLDNGGRYNAVSISENMGSIFIFCACGDNGLRIYEYDNATSTLTHLANRDDGGDYLDVVFAGASVIYCTRGPMEDMISYGWDGITIDVNDIANSPGYSIDAGDDDMYEPYLATCTDDYGVVFDEQFNFIADTDYILYAMEPGGIWTDDDLILVANASYGVDAFYFDNEHNKLNLTGHVDDEGTYRCILGPIFDRGIHFFTSMGGDGIFMYFITQENVYVDDDADPSWYDESHVKTIAEANTNVSAGGTIYIYNGTYTTGKIHMYKSGVNVTGESKDGVRIIGPESPSLEGSFEPLNGGAIFEVHNHYITISNLSMFSNSYACVASHEGIAYLTVKNCTITKSGTTRYGIYLYKSMACTVQDCDIFDIWFYGVYIKGYSSSSHFINNSNITNCSTGIYCTGDESSYIMNNYIAEGGGGIEINDVDKATIYNNDIKDNEGIGIKVVEDNDNNFIISNTISGGEIGIYWCDNFNFHNNISYNTIEDNECGIYIGACAMCEGEFEPSGSNGNYSLQAPIASNLMTENQTNPVCVRTTIPYFNWTYYNAGPDQNRFQIQVGTSEGGSNMWDYTAMADGNPYTNYNCDASGIPLNRNITYYVRVRVYDGSVWSDYTSGDSFKIDKFNNVIYGNIFLNNVNHSIISTWGGCNPTDIDWNISYYQVGGVNYGGGNYWDNYTGVDNFHGVNQDIPGSDNVGDTPYVIPQISVPMDEMEEMGEYFTQGHYQDQYPTFSIGEDTLPTHVSNVEATTATLHGWYGWQGTNPATCGFYCGINGSCVQTNFQHNFTASGTYTNETFSKGATGLNASYCHCFNVWAKNSTGFYHPTTTTKYFLTKPSGPPENFSVAGYNATNITLTWDNVTDWTTNPDIIQTTIIRYSNTSQPATPTDGTLGYWGTAETYAIEGLDLDVQYYFSAWTNIRAICNGTYVRYQNSSEFSTITAYTQGGDYTIFVRYENRTYGLVNLSEEFPVYTCDRSDLTIYDEPFSTGNKHDVNVSGAGNLILNTTADGNFTLSGYRVSPDYSLSGVADNDGIIAWGGITSPPITNITVFYDLSTNGGFTWNGWEQASNGGSINGISVGTNMKNYLIRLRQNLTTTNNLTTPELTNLYINIKRTCMWVNHSGPHKVIIHYYGQDFDDYYGMVNYIIFENGTVTDPMTYLDYSNMTNGSFNFSVGRTIKYIEFCWNDTTDCDFRCNRIISPVRGQRNITFYIRTDLPVFGEGTNYMNGSIVKYLYSFVDETGKFRRPNEPRATIYTYNNKQEKMIIHSEYFDDTEAIHPWLVYEKKYFIGVDCLYLTYERIGIAPASENQNPEVRIPYNYQFDYSFYDLINLDVGWFDSGFYVHYHDTTFSTVNATFKVYGYYNHTLLYTDTTTHSGKNFTYTCNTSGNYIWVIETTLDDLDNFYDGTYSSGETPMFSGMQPITDIDTIDDILTIILGRTPLHDTDNPDVEVPWTYIMIFALSFIVMTSLGKLNAFVGALGVGFVLTFSGAAITGLQTLFSSYEWWHGPVLILIGVFVIAFGIVGLMGGVED